jgi:CBS domain containing-hemolysin-like protein
MLLELLLALAFTLVGSALCSTVEAMLLSTTVAEVEALKTRHPRAGAMLASCRDNLEECISAILTFNTIANTFGSFVCGALASHIFHEHELAFAIGMTLGILIFGEIVPKNVGVLYRVRLHPSLILVLQAMRLATRPFSWLMRQFLKLLPRKAASESAATDEITLLAKKEANEGNLTTQESNLIANALKLDEVFIRDIMTPRIVVTAIDKSRTIAELFRDLPNIPFARIPVYEGNLDNVVGIVRRRDLLKAKAADQDHVHVADLMQPVVFVPETATATTTLQQFLKNHLQMAVVVDEYGLLAGVVSMEDIFEHLLGSEIFEKDDLAMDMRELAHGRAGQRLTPVAPRPASPDSARKSG